MAREGQSCTKWWFNNQHDESPFCSHKTSWLIDTSLIFPLLLLQTEIRNIALCPNLFSTSTIAEGNLKFIPYWNEDEPIEMEKKICQERREHPWDPFLHSIQIDRGNRRFIKRQNILPLRTSSPAQKACKFRQIARIAYDLCGQHILWSLGLCIHIYSGWRRKN